MGHVTVRYRLPVTELVVTGTLVKRRDELSVNPPATLAGAPCELESVAYALVTRADSPLLEIAPNGWLRSYKGNFTFGADGRLSGASAESTGELGTVVKHLASIAGSVAGAVALGGDRVPDGAAIITRLAGVLGATVADLEAYKVEHAVEYEHALRLLQLQGELRIQALEATQKVASGEAAARGRLNDVQFAARSVGTDLQAVVGHYAGWRASKITTVSDTFELRIPLTDIPLALPVAEWAGPNTVHDPERPATLQHLWERFGTGIIAHWPSERAKTPTKVTSASDSVLARRPEAVEVEVVEHRQGVRTSTIRQRELVVDSHSPIDTYRLKKSFWRRKSLDLTFDANGFLTGVGVEGESIAGALEAVAGAPGAYAGGVEAATKVSTTVAAARRAGLDSELAKVKAEVELRQQHATAAGLDATEADAARLLRLQQLQSILETQAKINSADPALVGHLNAGSDLPWYSPPPPPRPPEPQVVHVVVSREDAAPGIAPGAVQPAKPAPPL